MGSVGYVFNGLKWNSEYFDLIWKNAFLFKFNPTLNVLGQLKQQKDNISYAIHLQFYFDIGL